VHTYTLDWTQHTVRLSTSRGRMTMGFRIPRFSEKYVGHPIATADLCFRNGRWWLHVVVDVPEPARVATTAVVGVDLGLNRPAVTSQRQFLGSQRWKERDRRFFRLKRKLQSNGSKSARRHLKKMGRQQARFHRDPRSRALQTSCAKHARRGNYRVREPQAYPRNLDHRTRQGEQERLDQAETA
jgi:putative transposase